MYENRAKNLMGFGRNFMSLKWPLSYAYNAKL